LNKLDIVIIIFVIIFSLLGFRKGFLRSIISLIGIVAGILLAVKFHSYLTNLLVSIYSDKKIMDVVSFILIFIVVYNISIYIARKISGANRATKFADKFFGLFLGAFKGFLLISIILLITVYFNFVSEKTQKESGLYPYVFDFSYKTYIFVTHYIPPVRKTFEDFFYKDTTKINPDESE